MPVDSGEPDTLHDPEGQGHLGDPLGEQRAFFERNAVVDCSDFSVIALSGPDRLTWLDALSTQHIASLAPHTTVENLILSPQGRVEHRWLMTDDGTTSWLLVEPDRADSLVAWLEKMRFRADVTIADHSEALGVWAMWTDHLATKHAANIDAVVWRDPWPEVAGGGFAYSGPDHPGHDFALVFVAVSTDANCFADVRQAGRWALDAADIRAGRPRLASEVDDRTLPHELDWLRTAVHLNKGCYRGQESVAKVHNLGRPPRRLVLLHLDGSESVLPRPGDEVHNGENQVGYITRAVIHHEWGPIALAVIKRSVAADETLSVHSEGAVMSANQDVLVSPDAGRTRAPQFPAR